MNRVNIFVAELVGTFGLVLAATGSIVLDGAAGFVLGPAFVALAHFAGLAAMVFVFGRYSMAHFNPAVTLGFVITGHTRVRAVPVYLSAQAAGAVSASLLVKYTVGNHAKLGLNAPNPEYYIGAAFGAEVLATALLMGVILAVVGGRMHAALAGVAIGGMVAIDVLLFGPVSGASMNPMRSLAPAAVTGLFYDLWLYWTAPFLGSALVAAACRRRLAAARARREGQAHT